MTNTMHEFLTKERTRLTTEREVFVTEQKNLAEKIAQLDRELHAIDVYEKAREGKPATPKAPRGSHRETVLSLLTASPGLAPKDIRAKLGDNTPKGLSNLLAVLKKQKKVKEQDGKYTVV